MAFPIVDVEWLAERGFVGFSSFPNLIGEVWFAMVRANSRFTVFIWKFGNHENSAVKTEISSDEQVTPDPRTQWPQVTWIRTRSLIDECQVDQLAIMRCEKRGRLEMGYGK